MNKAIEDENSILKWCKNNDKKNNYCPVPWAVFTHKTLSPSAKLLFGILVKDARESRVDCFHSNQYLSETLNVTVNSIQRLLAELRKEGLIEVSFCTWNGQKINRKIICL